MVSIYIERERMLVPKRVGLLGQGGRQRLRSTLRVEAVVEFRREG